MISFKIDGIVREKETSMPMEGLFIKAYDKDLLFDDLLGSAISNHDGKFSIVCEPADFRDFFEKKPDIYFKIFGGQKAKLIYDTKDAIRWNAGRISDYEILI